MCLFINKSQSASGDCDIRSYYNMLRGSYSVIFPLKGIWGLRHLSGFPSLFGLQYGERYSLVII